MYLKAYTVAIASLLAGAACVHAVFAPDLVRSAPPPLHAHKHRPSQQGPGPTACAAPRSVISGVREIPQLDHSRPFPVQPFPVSTPPGYGGQFRAVGFRGLC